MRPVLIIQNQITDGPAYLVTWLQDRSIPYETVCVEAGTALPASINDYSALAIMGGGMSANDDLMSNRQAEILILQAVFRNRPMIGHCLGGQLMTRALGGTVGPSRAPEIGWQPIDYSTDIMAEHWFGRAPTPRVMHWHYEAFSIPEGARRLASSEACTNQAWSLGPHLAMQFHIEIDRDKALAWSQDPDPLWTPALQEQTTVDSAADILTGIDRYLEQHQRMADHVYGVWLSATVWADHARK